MKNFKFFKSLLVLIGVLITSLTTQVWATHEIYEVYLVYEFNGSSNNWTYYLADNKDNPVNDLGTLTSNTFKIKEIYWKTRDNWKVSNICAYALYNIGGGETLMGEYTNYYGSADDDAGGCDNHELGNSSVNHTVATANTGNSGLFTFSHFFKATFKNGSEDNWTYCSNNSKNYNFTYKILPPNATAITATPTGAISGSGTELDPYIVPYGGNLTIALSGSTKAREDANSVVQYSVDGGSTWATSSYTFSNVTATSTQNYVFKARCYNSTASLASPTVTTKTVYYKASYGVPVYKFVIGTVPSSGNVCSSSTPVSLTTADDKLSTLKGGTLTAKATGNTSNISYNTNSLNFNGGNSAWLVLGLDNKIKSGDVIRYRYNNSNTSTLSIQTTKGTTTNQINLPGNSKTTIQTVAITDAQATAFASLGTIYLVRTGGGTSYLDYFEILRPYAVTLDANTNGGKVGGKNTATMYFAAGEPQALPHATKSSNRFTGWFTTAGGSSEAANPYTATGNATLYAQFETCASIASGTVYKFQLKTGLTNGNTGITGTFDVNKSNYLSTLTGGTLTGYDKDGTKMGIQGNNAFKINEKSNAYLQVDLDCPIQAGDTIITTITNSGTTFYIAKPSASTTSVQDLSVGSNQKVVVPAGLVDESTLLLKVKDNSKTTCISSFEIKRPTKYTVSYNNGGGSGTMTSHSVAKGADQALTANTFTKNGYTFSCWHADVAVKVGGSTISAGGDISDGATLQAISSDVTLTAQWTCTDPTFDTDLSTTQVDYEKDASATALTVAASANSGTIGYQWYSNDGNDYTTPTELENCTTATYTPLTTSAGTTYYFCVATNKTGSCTNTTNSKIAKIVVTDCTDVGISGQPSSVGNANVGSPTSLSVTASGTNPTYQWYKCDDAEKTNAAAVSGSAYSGATTATLSYTPASAGVTYYYCVVSGDCGDDVTSNVVSITAKTALSLSLSYSSTVTKSGTISPTLTGNSGSGTVTYSLNSVSPDGSMTIVSSTGVVTGVTVGGTATVTATVAATDGYWGGSATSGTITVVGAVTYKANNGTAESDVVRNETTFASNSTTSFTVPSTKAFTGWNTEADGTGTHYDVGDAVPGSLTVYADWKYKVYYIASSTSESNDITAALATKYVVSVHETTGTSYNASDYTDYALIVLSESLDGSKAATDNHELQKIITVNKPILNLKTFFYGADGDASKRWKWGAPNAGKKPKCIYVKNNTYANLTSHPIYSGLTPDGNDSIQILKAPLTTKPIQPIGSFASGCEGYTLALVPNKSSGSGAAIHELTAAQRSTITSQSISSKYLMISLQSGELSNLSDNGKTLIKNAANYLITGSQWVPQYAITHSAAEHGDYTIKVGDASAVSTNTTANYNQTITLAATPSEGYRLDSWTVTGDVSRDDITVTSNQFTMPAEAVTVEATFVEDSYTISFDGNGADGGTDMDDVENIDPDDDVELAANTWEKTEHTFAGWKTDVALTYVEKGGEDEVEVDADGIVPDEATIKNITGNITLTAQWQVNEYDVHFWVGIDVSVEGRFSTYEYGEEKVLPTTVLRSGYLFDGWYDNSSLTGDPVTQMPADATGEQDYYPKWKALSAKCLYITGEVIDAYNDVAADPGYYMLNDVKYVFGEGYDDNEDALVLPSTADPSYIYIDPKVGTLKEVQLHISDIADKNTADKGISWGFDEDDSDVGSVGLSDLDEISDHEFSFRPTDADQQCFVFQPHATTLTIDNICVFYEAKTYSVTYDRGTGASGTAPSDLTTYYYNDVVTVQDTTGTSLKKTGFTFRGWFDGTTFYVVGDKFKITGNTTLTAVWQSDSGCEGRSVGSLFKMQVATGLSNGPLSNDDGDFCTLTTSNYLSTLKGGSAKAHNNNEHTTISGTNAINLTNNDSYIEFTLPSAIQKGDVLIYSGTDGVELDNSATKSGQVSIAGGTNVTTVIGSGNDLVGYSKIYMYRQKSTSTVTYFEVRRPVFYMSVGTPSATNFALGTTALTTSNGLDVLTGGAATAGCKNAAGDMKLRGSSNYDLHFYDKDDGYLKLDLDNALAQGDVLSFTCGSGNNQLAITTSTTWSNSIGTSSKSYTIPALSDLIGVKTIYLWGYSGQSYVKTLSIIRAADAVSGGGDVVCHYTVSFACKTGYEALDSRLPENTVGVPSGAKIGTPADPFAIGYAFLGWYKDASCSVGQEIKLDTLTITNNMTIYAKWVDNVKTFTGDAGTTAWETAGNWDAAGAPNSEYPYCYSQIYIKKPAVIAKDTKERVGRVDIVNDGSSNTGKLTINSGAMLIVYDKVSRIENWSTKARLATISEDIYIGSERDDEAEKGGLNGALIMGGYEEDPIDSATVQFASLAYTKSTWTTSETSWGERDVNQYIGIPFKHTKVSDYKPYDRYTYTNVYLYQHDRWDNSWAPMSKNQDMYGFTGYDMVCFSIAPDAYTNPKPIFDLKGELVSTEDQRIHLRGYEGWYGAEANESMLANSWTAPINISSFEVSDFENAEATIYMFNAGTSSEYDGNMEWASKYSTYPGQYTAIPINDLKLHPYYYTGYKTIPSMQSFSIITLDNDGNSLTKHDLSYLTLDYKRLVYDPAVAAVSVPTEPMHAPRRAMAMDDESPLAIMLHVHGVSGLGDRIRILEREDFSFGRDNGWETSKLLGIIEAPSLYAVTEVGDQATTAVPDVEGLILTFQAGEYDDVYTFNFEYDESEEPLYLYDRNTGIYTRILSSNTYSFVTTDKDFNERFSLTRNYNAPEITTGVESTTDDSLQKERVQKVLIKDHIYILRDGHIYDATGAMVK